MSAFKAGFTKIALEHGLSAVQAAHMFDRAMDYEGTQAFVAGIKQADDEDDSADSLESLAELMKHQALDEMMSSKKKSIGL